MTEIITNKQPTLQKYTECIRAKAIAAHYADSLKRRETADVLIARLTNAVQRYDLDSLQRLHTALTKREFSYYAAWTINEVGRAMEMLEAAFARLGKKVPGAPGTTRNRVKKQVQPLDLEDDLFADQSRWPRRPYCSDDLENGVRIRGLKQALLHPYISANPPHLRVWSMFDIDRENAVGAWEVAGLPPPAWTAVNKLNGHAHSVWGLTAPVLVDGLGARDAPMRYLVAVESMMREKLQADQGFAGLITKNPAHPLWETLRGPRQSYSLQELAEYLPGIEKHRPNKSAENIGLGRNVTLFDGLRKWSYKAIRKYWGGGLQGWNAWLSACNSQGLCINADLFGIHTLDGKEVWHIAKSVAKWTWRNTTPQGFSEWQSQAAIKSAKVRAAASEDKRSSARLMRAKGMTIKAIADELNVSIGSVHKWCA